MFDSRPYNHSKEAEEELERCFSISPFGVFNSYMSNTFKTDLTDNGNEYLLEAELPGYKKEDIKIKIEDDVLTISAEHKTESSDESKNHRYIRRERTYGSFSRSFDVSNVNTDAINAKYEDGILKLTLPKKNVTKEDSSKNITID